MSKVKQETRTSDRIFAEALGKHLGYQKFEDWYQITRKDIKNFKQESEKNYSSHMILKRHKNSPFYFLKGVYPEYDWKPWLFKTSIRNFWKDDENSKALFQWLETKFNIAKEEDWYQVTRKDIRNLKIGNKVNIMNFLTKFYPTYNWKPWLFKNSPDGIWDNKEKRKDYYNWLKKELNIKNLNDWYQICGKVLIKNYNAGSLFQLYDNGYLGFLKEMEPDYNWMYWLFIRVPYGFWDERENRILYIKWLEKELKIKTPDDWYDISREEASLHKASTLLAYYGNCVGNMILELIPEYNLDKNKFKKLGKGQFFLFNIIQELFPNEIIEYNKKHPEIISNKGRKLELDIFLPNIKIAFEYQGIQHYKENYFADQKKFNRQQENDKLKKIKCKEIGISLYCIPYTWSRNKNYILEIMKKPLP